MGRDFTYAGDVVTAVRRASGSPSAPAARWWILFTRFPNTLALTIFAAVIFITVGVTIGIIAAVRRGTTVDRGLIGSSQVFGSIPYYIVALLFSLYFVTL